MNSSQIRHKNFQTLFEDFIVRHPNQPRHGMLKQFAQQLGLSDRYLSHIKCQRKNIGNSMARAIEAALDLPQGWMDREHNEPKAPVDEREKLFIETALILFRAQPDDATRLMLDLLRRQLLTPGALAQHAALGANP